MELSTGKPVQAANVFIGIMDLVFCRMRKIAESGVQDREVRRIYTRKPVCHSKSSNFGSVGMIDCYFPFVLFGGGVLLSAALFFMELGVKKILR